MRLLACTLVALLMITGFSLAATPALLPYFTAVRSDGTRVAAALDTARPAGLTRVVLGAKGEARSAELRRFDGTKEPLLLEQLPAGLLVLMKPSAAPDGWGMSTEDRKAAVRSLQELCWDTWCEGDVAYVFKTLACDSKTASCSVEVALKPSGEPKRKGTCVLYAEPPMLELGERSPVLADLIDADGPTLSMHSRIGDCLVAL